MKTTYILIVAATIATAAHAANTWWVDDDWYGQGGNGSEERPFGTIQDAIDASATKSGDTIKVKAGVYNKGGKRAVDGDCYSRVVVSKQVTILAVDGRSQTFIVGAPDPASANAYGLGNDATRCVCFNASTGGARLEGFTLCNGRTGNGDSVKGYGGGVRCAASDEFNFTVTDCTISNCVALAGGAIRRGRLYRCLVTDCYATDRVSATHNSKLHSCIITHCSERSGSSNGIVQSSTAVNCTFFANPSSVSCTAYNCIFAGNGSGEQSSTASTTTASDGYYQIFAPALGDYRPIAGSRAATLGSTSNIKQVTVYGYSFDSGTLTDYNGNKYPSSGTIAAGAVQETATPAAGALQFATSGSGFDIDGHFARSGDYVFPEAYPTQYQVKAAVPEGQYMFGFSRAAADGGMFYPQMDDTLWLISPPDSSRVVTNTAVFATQAFYDNPTGSNSGTDAGSSASTPFKTLQKAVDSCSSSSTYYAIFAAEGDYSEDSKVLSNSNPITNRVLISSSQKIRLLGAGAGKSFITGSVDPVTGGTGTGVIRPVACQSPVAAVQGFTLRGAGAYRTNTDEGYLNAGAFTGYEQNGNRSHLLDCTVTDCTGSAAVVYRCTVERCRIVGNTTMRNVMNVPVLVSSIVADNALPANNAVLGGTCVCIQSSVKGASNASAASAGVTASESVFHTGSSTAVAGREGCLFWDFGSYPSGATTGDPLFTALSDYDFRVLDASPAYTCGVVPTPSNYGADYWKYAGGDVDGNRLVFTDGKPLAGACHTPGVGNWYVDGVNGDDSNTGESSDAAKQSIGAVLSKGLPSGVTVHVAAGTYSTGAPMYGGSSATCCSRVVVPAGVTLEGAGADFATIVGAAAQGGDDLGLGDSAVRCVYLEDGATLRGFTLTGGRTAKIGAGTSAGKTDKNNLGGGVCGASAANCLVEDCVIDSCYGWRAGGAAYATLRRCRVTNCFGKDTDGEASGVYFCRLYSTVVDRCGPYAVMYPSVLEQSTVGPGNAATEQGRCLHIANGNVCRIVNSLVLTDFVIANDSPSVATNCYFITANSGSYVDWLGPNSVVTNAVALAVDENCVPVIGSNVAIDKADASLNKYEEAIDALAGQRVYNGALDVGAVEANWCNRYRADLGARRSLSVTAASPEVVETGSKKVRLVSGATLEALWINRDRTARDYILAFSLTDGASVAITLNGVSSTYDAAGGHEFMFRGASGSQNEMLVSCLGGSVDLLSAQVVGGTTIVIR